MVGISVARDPAGHILRGLVDRRGWIYPCIDGRDEDASQRLKAALEGVEAGKLPICALRLGDPSPADAERIWYRAPGFWLEREPAAAAPHI